MIIEQKERVHYSYGEFVQLTEDLLAENKTTGINHSEDYLEYTRLNLQRMRRVYKTTTIQPELVRALEAIERPQTWVVLVEAWCGDVPQNVPVIAKMAELNPRINLVLILRDENLDIMDAHLSYGGRGIPKLVIYDDITGNVLAEWGPRPFPAQQMVMDYKKLTEKPPYSEFVQDVQKWYAKDKTKTIQAEFIQLSADLV